MSRVLYLPTVTCPIFPLSRCPTSLLPFISLSSRVLSPYCHVSCISLSSHARSPHCHVCDVLIVICLISLLSPVISPSLPTLGLPITLSPYALVPCFLAVTCPISLLPHSYLAIVPAIPYSLPGTDTCFVPRASNSAGGCRAQRHPSTGRPHRGGGGGRARPFAKRQWWLFANGKWLFTKGRWLFTRR